MNRTPDLIAALRSEIHVAPFADLPSILGQVAALEGEVLARLVTPQQQVRPPDEDRPSDDGDRLLTVAETAQRLGQKTRWVRAHQNELPKAQLPGRSLRFSAKRLDAWMRRRIASGS